MFVTAAVVTVNVDIVDSVVPVGTAVVIGADSASVGEDIIVVYCSWLVSGISVMFVIIVVVSTLCPLEV